MTEDKENRLVNTLTRITLRDSGRMVLSRDAEAEKRISLVKQTIVSGTPVISSDPAVRIGKMDVLKGKAIFIMEVSGIEVSFCYSCWDGVLCDEVWKEVGAFLRDAAGLNSNIGSPPPVPWLTSLTAAAYDNLRQAKAAFVNSAEPCIVWALMDLEKQHDHGPGAPAPPICR